MKPVVITEELAAEGMRVTRGPSWEWGNQDGGVGGVGTITKLLNEDKYPLVKWVLVKWDVGREFYYRVGAEGKHDLALHVPFSAAESKKATIQNVRQALSQSIKPEFITEKSNRKHGNSNTRVTTTSTGAIKVRRPSRKIKGSEGCGS